MSHQVGSADRSIHMGGIYGDKETTLARFKENYKTKLSDNIKARLVLENDEVSFLRGLANEDLLQCG